MSWQFKVIVAYSVLNVLLNWWYAGSGKTLKATTAGAVLYTAWAAFVIWSLTA